MSTEAFVSRLSTWVWMSCTSFARCLRNYDTLNNLVPEDQAHLDSRLAVVLEEVINRYNSNAKVF
eukprot:12918319-Prorocentrum_lima.AAC.1